MRSSSGQNVMQRSVDSLQRLFSVVVALAITVAIQKVLFDEKGNMHVWYDEATHAYVLWNALSNRLPALLAFIFSIVPFYHGMNRHLDRIYVEREVPGNKEGYLVVDFFVFFLESCLLVAFASLVGVKDYAFIALMLLLAVDAAWAFGTHGIHYGAIAPSTARWGVINAVTIGVLLLFYCSNLFPIGVLRSWALSEVAVVRTIIDYSVCWRFYFPGQNPARFAGPAK